MGISSKDLSTQLHAVTFKCSPCSNTFNISPSRVEDAPDRDWHPWRYFAKCSGCGEEVGQLPTQVALMASFGKHTGPKTKAGKIASAKNIEGHPTPEEAQRTRFNAMKHGLNARVAMFFPSKPGSYDQCESCDISYAVCKAEPACMRQTELFMRHRIAVEHGDATMLNDLNADTQANLRAIMDNIILSVLNKGVAIETPSWYHDKDGGFHLAEYMGDGGEMVQLTELAAHPLLKFMMEMVSKNSLSLSDLALTPKVASEDEDLKGFLDVNKTQGATALDYQRKSADQMDKLLSLIDGNKPSPNREPITIDQDG